MMGCEFVGELKVGLRIGGRGALLRVPIAADGHQPVDTREIDDQADVAHPALPGVRDVGGHGIDVEVEISLRLLVAVLVLLFVLDVDAEVAVADVDQLELLVRQVESRYLLEQPVALLGGVAGRRRDVHQRPDVLAGVFQGSFGEFRAVGDERDRVTEVVLSVSDIWEDGFRKRRS